MKEELTMLTKLALGTLVSYKLVATTECDCEKLCMLQPVSIGGIVGSCWEVEYLLNGIITILAIVLYL